MKHLSLTEEEIDDASVDELRGAYRELLADARDLCALISTRTCDAVASLRARDLKFNGNLPYGLESDNVTRKLKASRYEKRLIVAVKKLHASGLPLRAIARTLAERSFVNRKGKPLDAKQISRILAADVENPGS